MDFWQAIVSGFKNYVGFSGRACRSEYWYWVLAMIILSIIAGVIDYTSFEENEYGAGPARTIIGLATFLPSLALCFRRLHDIDRTGWWWLISFTVIGLFVLLYWACVRGTTGPNRYGPDPLGGANVTHQ
jgi:uncharacterized membrane protein YhaH (DUF805 family)